MKRRRGRPWRSAAGASGAGALLLVLVSGPAVASPAVVSSAVVSSAVVSSAVVSSAVVSSGGGAVDVYYAASLLSVMEQSVAPRFERATKDSFVGFPGASGSLANELKGGIAEGDVFISASPAVNEALRTAPGTGLVSWYLVFANSPLVLGYNPHSTFAAQLRAKPWYKVITERGFRLGRTDPATDPKGKLTLQAIGEAERLYKARALAAVTRGVGNVYPEQVLVGELQSGQLDAAFFYSSEAKAAGLPTVKLGRIHLAATYTVTILGHARHEKAAEAFVSYLLGRAGSSLLHRGGLSVVRLRLVGDRSSMAPSLRHLLPAT